MLEQLQSFLKNNGFAAGGIAMLLGGSVIGVLWKSYYQIIRLWNYLFFLQITFTSQDSNFTAVQNWLFNQSYTTKRCSNLMVRNIRTKSKRVLFERADEDTGDTQIFIPSYGSHYFFIGLRPTIMDFTKSDDKELRYRETVHLQIFCIFNKIKLARKIVEECNILLNKDGYKETNIYTCLDHYGDWSLLLKKNIRQQPILSTPTEYDEIVAHIQYFVENEEWYTTRGINYKCGLLFAGVPGSGKSTSILSLAQYFKRHIYILNLANNSIDDNKFLDLITSLPNNSIFLIEDIDAVSFERKEVSKDKTTEQQTVSLTTILNSLDGVLTPDGLIFFITTNYPEKLDEALIRKGRIDKKVDFANANEYQCKTILRRFIPNTLEEEEKEFIKLNVGKPMAELESELVIKLKQK